MPSVIEQVDALDFGALFSPCRRWRYMLWRRWSRDGGACVFIGLNPSTADETVDDPTIRRCIRFAKDWGHGSLWMLNAYAWRATRPADMKAQGGNAVGPLNDEYIAHTAMQAERVVAAWGVHCDELREARVYSAVHSACVPLYTLGLTKDGHPKHPLYLRADTEPVVWDGPSRRRSA